MTISTAETPKPAKRANSRQKIIDAALELIQAHGASNVSLDAVAERAGLSKGGLLYNFPSKTDLLQALVAHHIDLFAAEMSAAEQSFENDGKPNTLIRSYVHAFRRHMCEKSKSQSGFLAAVAAEPRLLDPVRAYHTQLIARLQASEDDSDMAIFTFLAMEGVRSMFMLDTSPFNMEQTDEILMRLTARLELTSEL